MYTVKFTTEDNTVKKCSKIIIPNLSLHTNFYMLCNATTIL